MDASRSSYGDRATADATWRFAVAGLASDNEEAVAAVLAVGNGIVTVRGTVGPPTDRPATFFPGVFDPGDERPSRAEGEPTLVAAPSWFAFEVHVDGERLRVEGATLDRALHLRRGLVRARFVGGGRSGPIIVEVEQLAASVALLQRIRVTLDGTPATVAIDAPLQVEPADAGSWRAGRLVLLGVDGPHGMVAARASRGSTYVVALQRLRARERGLDLEEERVRRIAGGVAHRVTWRADAGQTLQLDRRVVVAVDPSLDRARRHVMVRDARIESDAAGFAEERPAWWVERWRRCEVRIGGDPRTERAVRLAAYHLTSSAGRAPLGPRPHAATPHFGHVMRDSDTLALPFFVFTWPEAARGMLLYRHRGLAAARKRAEQLGWRGALYAREAGERGVDHVSADVAYAVWQYWCATRDEPFLRDAGVEILVETAKFWASRAERGDDGDYHVRGVNGPDDYHGNVDDSAYTNLMARANLQFALRAFEWLARNDQARARELERNLGVVEGERDRWRAVAEGLHVAVAEGAIEAFDGWHALEEIDVASFGQKGRSIEATLGSERLRRARVVKQADVLLSCLLLRDRLDERVVRRCFDEYEPRCDPEGSSFSSAIHAAVAARLGLYDVARKHLDRAVAVDFEPQTSAGGHGTEQGGMHTGACGGLFQAIAFGALGATATEEALLLAPRLLPGWTSLDMSLVWRGSRLAIHVNPGGVEVAVTEGLRRVKVRIFGDDLELAPGTRTAVRASASEVGAE
jgi:kojibiose phosphorylase